MYEKIKTKSDMQKLIDDEVKENLHLDFKASTSLGKTDRNKQDISKDVSAFANSDGGTLVYGMVEDGHVASRIDGGVDEIDKEWLENIITSTISPRVNGVIIYPIAMSDDKFNYIVHIPKSNRAPHQAIDKKFYKRFNFKNEPMEQYEILDVMNRESAPELSLELSLDEEISDIIKSRSSTDCVAYQLDAKVINNSETPADFFVTRIYLDERIRVIWPFDMKEKTISFQIDNQNIRFHELSKTWLSNEDGKVWKGIEFPLFRGGIVIDVPKASQGDSFIISYIISAPHMAPVTKFRVIHAHSLGSHRISRNDLESESDVATEAGL